MRHWTMVAVISGLVVGGAGSAAAQDPKVSRGASLFAEQKCAICHSVAGKGNQKHPLDGAGKTLTADLVRLWLTDVKAAEVKTGKKAVPPMKSYAALPAADLDALVAFVLSLK